MFGRKGMAATLAVIMVTALAATGTHADEKSRRTDPVKIGMVSNLFRTLPPTAVNSMLQPFSALMQSLTGVAGTIEQVPDAKALGEQLDNQKLQLGVCNGYEFAWIRQKHPTLRPLMIAVNHDRHLVGHLIVRSDSPAVSAANLTNEPFAIPVQSREHSLLYLQERCVGPQKDPAKFFSKVTTPTTEEEALDDVVEGGVAGTIVDGRAWECYKTRKPGRVARLKIIQTSETFPSGVIVYRQNTLDKSTLKSFRNGLLNANRTFLGRQLMTLWRLSGFEVVPADYEETLVNIAKAYPPPSSSK